MLKLKFLGSFRGFWIFPRVLGPDPIKYWNVGGPKLKFWATRSEGAYACFPKNPNFDYTIGPTLNSHNSLILNPNYTKFMFKLKSMMSNFQWNKFHSKNICGSKDMVKIVSIGHFSALFSKRFETLLSCDYFWTIKITSITICWYIELIIGAKD